MPRLHRHAVLLRQEREHPVGLGDEVLDRAFAVDDHSERRALDPADGEDVFAAPPRGKADEPGQRRPPHQVDRLAGFAGGREGEVEIGQVLKGGPDLCRGDCREPGPVDLDRGVHRADELVGLLPDQFSFGIVVGGDGDEVRLL